MANIDEWWPQRAIEVLLKSGWTPGRAVEVSCWRTELAEQGFAMHEAAERVLAEFGGLLIEAEGAGVRHGRCTVEVDPTLGTFSRSWEEKVGAQDLYPLGEVDWGHAVLAIDADGAVFMLWGPGFTAVGKGRDAIIRLTEGDY
ncbi:SUKH-3 domain-containing protein [Allokutzneria sp. NRRL B-24872]|uniref:SUKH-3 domain-containing protein n=1 Tax=Allokutzneria sp. NRRL B-24872 TaxID=1137961 RepID=UPI00143D06BB|nr:SUKH-3 domain-containing protein [Allokutzneria sp. NRRL B-24872]